MTILLEINKTPTLNIRLTITHGLYANISQLINIQQILRTQPGKPVCWLWCKQVENISHTHWSLTVTIVNRGRSSFCCCLHFAGRHRWRWLVVICDQCLDLQQSTPSWTRFDLVPSLLRINLFTHKCAVNVQIKTMQNN